MAKQKISTNKVARKSGKPPRSPAKKKSYRSAAATEPVGVVVVDDERGRPLLQLRARLGMNRETFARLVPISVRHLASIESGQEPTDTIRKRLTELRRVVQALNEVIQGEAIGPWLNQPNEAFDGLKPVEVIERGEVDRIWEMIFFLRSGVSF